MRSKREESGVKNVKDKGPVSSFVIRPSSLIREFEFREFVIALLFTSPPFGESPNAAFYLKNTVFYLKNAAFYLKTTAFYLKNMAF